MLIEITDPKKKTEKPVSDSVAVGIDLGTTNSVVAVSENSDVIAVESPEGSALVPSVVSYDGDKVEVGQKAKKHLSDKKENVVRSIKRLMGKGFDDLTGIAEELPYKIVKDSTSNVPVINVGNKNVTAVEVSAEILKKLKIIAEKKLKKKVNKAVITVPAYFDDAARVATKDAAKLAGIEVLRLINEPTAAALAYGLDNAAEGIYAVYDLGGGTFDISILKMEKGVFRVLSTAGDTALGGDDFDNEIVKYLCRESGKKYPENSVELNALLEIARDMKEQLSLSLPPGEISSPLRGEDSDGETIAGGGELKEGHPHPNLPPSRGKGYFVGRDDFEDLIRPYIQRTINICRQAVSDAKTDEEIKGAVLVGGSTRIPLVRKMVKEFFGKEPLANIDCDKVVAYGAAIQAENLTHGSGTLLMDVTPLSLGLETYGGLVEKIIERNTPIPAAKSQEFTTYQDGQAAMKIHVVQGERERVEQCRSLAHFNLTGIPPMKAGLAKIKVSFTVDADGLLTVSAKELSTGKEQQVSVKPSYGLPPEKIEEMLRDSFAHAKEDILERLLMDARIEAEQMIKYIKDAIASDGDLLETKERKAIEDALKSLEEVKKTGNRDEIDYKVHELDKTCSGFAEKRVNRALSNALAGKKI